MLSFLPNRRKGACWEERTQGHFPGASPRGRGCFCAREGEPPSQAPASAPPRGLWLRGSGEAAGRAGRGSGRGRGGVSVGKLRAPGVLVGVGLRSASGCRPQGSEGPPGKRPSPLLLLTQRPLPHPFLSLLLSLCFVFSSFPHCFLVLFLTRRLSQSQSSGPETLGSTPVLVTKELGRAACARGGGQPLRGGGGAAPLSCPGTFALAVASACHPLPLTLHIWGCCSSPMCPLTSCPLLPGAGPDRADSSLLISLSPPVADWALSVYLPGRFLSSLEDGKVPDLLGTAGPGHGRGSISAE